LPNAHKANPSRPHNAIQASMSSPVARSSMICPKTQPRPLVRFGLGRRLRPLRPPRAGVHFFVLRTRSAHPRLGQAADLPMDFVFRGVRRTIYLTLFCAPVVRTPRLAQAADPTDRPYPSSALAIPMTPEQSATPSLSSASPKSGPGCGSASPGAKASDTPPASRKSPEPVAKLLRGRR
jgi:hypothetical protein